MKRFLEQLRIRRSIREDLQAHMEERIDDLVESGLSEAEARLQARREFGNVSLVAEDSRAALGWTWLEQIGQDLRYAVRMLWHSPGFTAVAILSLALGIGANTAIFGLLDTLVLRTLPVGNPRELWTIGPHDHSYPQYALWRDQNQSIGALAAGGGFIWRDESSNGDPTLHDGEIVSGNYFELLQVRALIGRTIAPADDSIEGAGGPQGPVVMLSYRYWNRAFRRDASVLGRSINVNGVWATVIGVTPPEFFGIHVGLSPDVFVPIQLQPRVIRPDNLLHSVKNTQTTWLSVLGRIKPGVSQAQVKSDLLVLATQEKMGRSSPSEQSAYLSGKAKLTVNLTLEPASRGFSKLRERFSEPLRVLMVLVAIVLLIACANVANLLLARANAREKEIAVRLAIGASRFRILRQLLTENLVLSLIGGGLGLLFALWSGHLLVEMLPQGATPLALEVAPDHRVLGFTLGVSLLTALLFGLAPAWRAAGLGVNTTLNLQRTHGRKFARLDPGKLVVVLELALAVPLLVGAGLFLTTLRNLVTIDAGFTRQNVVQMRINLGATRYPREQWPRVYDQIRDSVALVPGVTAVSLVNRGLMEGGLSRSGPVHYPGYTSPAGESEQLPESYIGPDYFAASGIPLREGRTFTERDGSASQPVAIVNEELVRRYFAGRNPIGQRYTIADSPDQIEIVGVVGDAKYNDLRQESTPLAYYPWRQVMPAQMRAVIVRTSGDPAALIPALRQAMSRVHPDLLLDAQTLTAQIESSLVRERLLAHLSGFLGGLAMMLACIGLYGVMAYGVARRTSEIGIRMALGAVPGNVVRMVLGESLVLAVVGIAIGAPVAVWLSRLVKSFLFGLDSTSSVVIAASAFSLFAVCVLAAWIPAWRAARIEPTSALRYE